MDHKLASFVAYATLSAYQRLAVVLARHKVAPTVDVVTDAARLGQQDAMERFFPGLVRSPFSRNPLPDIVLALRYQYEEDPENMHPAGNSSTGVRRPDDTQWRKQGETQAKKPDETQGGRYKIAPQSLQRPATPQPGADESSVRRLSSAGNPMLPQPVGQNPPKDESSRGAYPYQPMVGDESSTGAVGAGTPAGPMKLRTMGPAPVFPWEKRPKRDGDKG